MGDSLLHPIGEKIERRKDRKGKRGDYITPKIT